MAALCMKEAHSQNDREKKSVPEINNLYSKMTFTHIQCTQKNQNQIVLN